METAQAFGYAQPMRRTKDVRHEPRVRVRIHCTPTMHVIAGGHRLERGDNELIVYQSDIEKIQAEVEESQAELHAAQKAHEKHEIEYYKKRFGKTDVTEAEKESAPYPGSVEYEFRARMDRDIKPLTKLEMLEEMPPPEEALMNSPQLMVNHFADSIAKALAEYNISPPASSKSNDKAQKRSS